MPECLIPGCNNVANDGALSIRCRDRNTNAIWSPNLDAYLCDFHALQGCTIDVIITPNTSEHLKMITRSGDNVVTKIHAIAKKPKADDEDSLFNQSK